MLLGSRVWPIALDIGTESIRMLQLARSGDMIRTVACGRWAFPDSLGAEAGARRGATVEAVRQMLRANGFKGRRVVTALPSSALSIQNLRLTPMSPEQTEQLVRSEADDRFGFPVSGNQLNYLNAGQVRSGDEVRNEIILLAAPEDVIQDHLAMLGEMDLEAEHIEAEPVALFRNLERYLQRESDVDAVSVAADIGVIGTCVVVARGREIVFVKFIDIGGRRMTEAVARQLNLDYQEARDIRRRLAHSQDTHRDPERREEDRLLPGDPTSVEWTIRDAMRTEVEALCHEISLCLRYCAVTFRGLRPDRITLSGGEARNPLCVEMISDQLGLECSVVQPLRSVDTSDVDFGEDRRSMMTDWALCAGMAFRQAGFAQERQESSRGDRRLSA